jgi:hypothetical protein
MSEDIGAGRCPGHPAMRDNIPITSGLGTPIL